MCPASGHGALPLPSSPVRNQPEVGRVLLSAGCRADAINSTQSTALHVAVQRGFLEVVRALCEHGCDVNLPVSSASTWPRCRLPVSAGPWVSPAHECCSLDALALDPSRSHPQVTTDSAPAGCPLGHAPALRHLGGHWRQWHRRGPHGGAKHRCHRHQQPGFHLAAPCLPQRPRAVSVERAHSCSQPLAVLPRDSPRSQTNLPTPTEL